MAISDAIQTLSAAFAFGTLLQAATGALFLYYKGHGKTIFKDGRRLVLVLFLLSAALWAQIDFLNLMLPTTTTSGCQATLLVSTAFDQLGRLGMEKFLLSTVGHGTKLTTERLILQGVLLVRLIGGVLLVGFTRPDFAPTCVASTLILPIAIVVLALDAIIISVLLIRALLLGMFSDIGNKKSGTQEQSKALVISIVGFSIWTGTSVPMILGIPTIILIVRTVLPASGLLVLVGIVTIFPAALLSTNGEDGTTPEARSPFMNPMPISREIFRDSVSNDGSPIIGHGYTKSGRLFIVNPSTPNDSPTTIFQSSSRGYTRGFTKLNEEITVGEFDNDGPTRLERPERPPKNILGYRESSGIFPSVLSQGEDPGAMASQIGHNIMADTGSGPTPRATVDQQKRSLFSRSKPPPKSVRSLGISQTVSLNVESSSAGAFPRMQIIDFATAATNERDRREGALTRAQLVANRTAPQPPVGSSEDALRRSVSVKRKEMPVRMLDIPIIPGSTAESSVTGANGSTTSASLSPGHDEVRRRSPRSGNGFNQVVKEESMALRTLQRKQTLGLPSGPRSQRMPMAKEIVIAKEQTVMLMNDIVYDNPGVVETIISGAPAMYIKRPKTADKASLGSEASLSSSGSIIHRPWPYKRDASKDRQLFPSELPPGHKRSKSGSSLTCCKSFLSSTPGSPTQLPPRPPPPTSASKLTRLLPNNIKSMNFDEKIQLLFPAPPGIGTLNRRSSVPSLPRVPSVFMADTPFSQSPATEESEQSRRASKRTTVASFALGNPDNPDISTTLLKQNSDHPQDRQTYRFSANTYKNIADDSGEPSQSLKAEVTTKKPSAQNSLQVPAKQSIIYDMRRYHFTEVITSDESSIDDSTSSWRSIHSEIPAIDISKAMTTVQPMYIKRVEIPVEKVNENAAPLSRIEVEEAIGSVMLDSEEPRRSFLMGPNVIRQSFFLEADEALPGDKSPSIHSGRGWHRRIGDELPTFSERVNPRSRKMPPPTPLLLGKRDGRQATVVIRGAEPSPPIDSPERAIKEIQEQLRRLEEPNRASVDSLLRRLPNTQNIGASKEKDCLRLLENLEMEMGQQENHWHQMQTDLNRDSMSVVLTPQKRDPSDALSRESSNRSSRTPSRVLDRRARIRSSITVRSKGEDSSRTTSTHSSDNSRASVWQHRLAEAQLEYMSNAPDLLRKRSLNFLHVSRVHDVLGSPTPPDSLDSETEHESASDSEDFNHVHTSTQVQKDQPYLWKQPFPTPPAATSRLWSHPCKKSAPVSSPELPAKNLRPAPRRTEQVLQISSIDLWVKPRSPEHSRPVVALWGSRLVRPRSIVTRPPTQKPPRKSKRVTFLPDIVESPSPLPNKRDTLGIFQFAWGEKSDQAAYQPTFTPGLLASPVLNFEPEPTEYSSSFFDDYEEEDNDDMIDLESDDDFDETTLWEIAGMLNSLPPIRGGQIAEDYDDESGTKSQENTESTVQLQEMHLPTQPLAIVSREVSASLSARLCAKQAEVKSGDDRAGLHQPEQSVWNVPLPASNGILRSKQCSSSTLPILATRDVSTASESESTSVVASLMWQSPSAVMKLSSMPIVSFAASSSFLWTAPVKEPERSDSGLFSVPVSRAVIRTTQAAPVAIKMVKACRQATSEVPRISSRNLWAPAEFQKQEIAWISRKMSSKAIQAPSSPSMWTPPQKIRPSAPKGLFDASTARSKYRASDLMPAATSIVRKARTSQAPLDALASTKLWTRRQKLGTERDWISESSVRPESPSVYSTVSSRSTSPTSDASSIKSTSTKASSIWGVSVILTWWDNKGSKSSPPSAPVEDSKPPLEIPVRQLIPKPMPKPIPKSTPLALIRESRVLASRHMWKLKAPIIEKSSSRKFLGGATTIKPAAKPTHRALRHQYRPPVAFRASWDDALAEAISSSLFRPIYSKADWESALAQAIDAGKPRSMRLATGKVEWETALAEAISLSQPRLQRSHCTPAMWEAALVSAIAKGVIAKTVSAQLYDPSVLHPAFFTERLVLNVTGIHPASIGHGSKNYDAAVLHSVFFTERLLSNVADIHPASIGHASKSYDASVLHPVFFTDRLISTVTDVHPAAIGHVKVQNATALAMWAPTSVSGVPQAASLWSKSTVTPRQAQAVMFVSAEPICKPLPAKNLDLPVLKSTSFWRPSQATTKERNWLISTKTVSAKAWVPCVASTEAKDDSSMWIAQPKESPLSPDQFASIKHEYLRASPTRPTALPRLSSSELFEKANNTHSATLHQTSKPARSMTWTVPVQTEDNTSEVGMWTATNQHLTLSQDLFAHFKHDHVRATPSFAVALPVLTSSELFAIVAMQESTTRWLHQTSKGNRSMNKAAPGAVSFPKEELVGLCAVAVKTSSSSNQEMKMWTAPVECKPTSPDYFAHIKSEHLRAAKRRPAALPQLTSTSLFNSASKPSIASRNWLHTTLAQNPADP